MKYKQRDGKIIELETKQDRLLNKLYTTRFGRRIAKMLAVRAVSNFGAFFLNLKISKIFIKSFIKKNNIDMSQYENVEYKSYNDFFTRKIKPDARAINQDQSVIISPCDGKLTLIEINDDTVFYIKNGEYTSEMLLKDKALAEEFKGGWCFVFRLTVDDYHRYSYPCDGKKERDIFIPGVLHTVNPVAAENMLIYKENCRTYAVLNTEKFGRIVQMEVGALMVGKITNHHKGEYSFKKGEEKGFFEFGGSTIILLIKKDKIEISPDILNNTGDDSELLIKMGEEIGKTVLA